MKNKKLFAILTLVCFMMTLMPVAAFAADMTNPLDVEAATVAQAANGDVVLTVKVDSNVTTDVVKDVTYTVTGNKASIATTPAALTFATTGTPGEYAVTLTQATVAAYPTPQTFSVVATDVAKSAEITVGNTLPLENIVEFNITKEHIAFAKSITATATTLADVDTSAIYTVKADPTVKLNAGKAYLPITADFFTATRTSVDFNSVYIWFTEEGKETSTSAFSGLYVDKGVNAAQAVTGGATDPNVVYVNLASGVEYYAEFVRPGTYVLHAAFVEGTPLADSALLDTDASNRKVVVKEGAADVDYVLQYAGAYYTDGSVIDTITVPADGIVSAAGEIELKLFAKNNATGTYTAIKGATVNVETSSANIEVSDEKVVTSATGRVAFDIAGVREGAYKVYVSYGSYESVINVNVGASEPDYISAVKVPTAPVSIDGVNANGDLRDIVRFLITDINGNTLTGKALESLTVAEIAAGNPLTVKAFDTSDLKYVTIVSQPKDSVLTDADVYLVADDKDDTYATISFGTNKLTAEGTYEFKVALNNGKTAYATVEVKEFGTPVGIVLEYAAPSVELGGRLATKALQFVDANGVTEDCNNNVDLAVSGYAVDNFYPTAVGPIPAGTIEVKADEKYLGSTITVTAVSERYDLVTTATVKVVAEAAGLMFTSKTAEVDVNNSIQVVLADAQGNRTALSSAVVGGAAPEISYVVLDKPEGAKVSVNFPSADNKLAAAGSFKMNLTCNKVGTVKVQVIAKMQELTGGKEVTKYYTGIGEFAVGNGQVGKAVVLSIGSSTMIVDGKAVVLEDTKAIIKDNRTFVPFRALAEAFGAKVDYNAADHSVVATLNGVTVVMPIGETTYTVNGIAKTADVAPFVDENNRTLVPVRFVANAFGIEVNPIYNDDRTVADVLFNM